MPPAPVVDAEGNTTLLGSDNPDAPNTYGFQLFSEDDTTFTLRQGARILTPVVAGIWLSADDATIEIEAGAEISATASQSTRGILVTGTDSVINNRGDIEATEQAGNAIGVATDRSSGLRLNNFGRIILRGAFSAVTEEAASGDMTRSLSDAPQANDILATQVFNQGLIQADGTLGRAVELRRSGGLLENYSQIIGGVRMIGNRARLFNDGSIDAGNQRHNLAIDFGASLGSRTRILASNNRPVLNPNDRIFNTSQTLEIGPHSQINGTIRFGAKAVDPEDATISVPDVLRFVARDADENGTQDPFIDMNLLVIDDFDLDKIALPANRMVMVSEPLEGDELQEFIKAGFVGQDENGNLLQGEDAGRDLIVRRVALLATPAPIVPPVEPPESVDPEPVIQPIVPPVISPTDTGVNGQTGGQQPDANTGQPDNTDGEQSSVQGMVVLGGADGNGTSEQGSNLGMMVPDGSDSDGDTEPQMPINPLPPAPVSPPESVDPEPMVQPGVPPVINPPDSDTNGQAGGQQPDANTGQPDNTDGEQGSVQGMVVLGGADGNGTSEQGSNLGMMVPAPGGTDSDGDTEPQIPINPTPPAPVNPAEPFDPEPVVQPGVPPVINPPDTATNGQTGGQQPDANIGQPDNTDGEQRSVQGMMVSGTDGGNQPEVSGGNGAGEQGSNQSMMIAGTDSTDSDGDTEPQMPINPTPPAPVNPPDTATREQPDGTREQDNNQNRVVPNGVDQQGNNQGMVVSGTDNTDGNNQPAGPDGNGASEQPDTHTTQPDGEGNEGESAPLVPATPTDTTVPPQVVASEQTSRVFQAQFLAQTAERIFAAPTRRLGDTRPLARRFKVSRANVGRPLTKLSTGLNLNGRDEQPNNSSAAWLSALGGQSRRHAGGAEQVFAGLAVGTERLLNPEVLGGVYTGVLRSDQRLTSGRELHSKASFVGLYGRLERADTLMDLDIGVAYQRYKRQRRVLENGTVRMAHADHGGWLLGAGLGIGQRLHLGARRSFTPLLRLRYSGAFDQGYTERGTQANLTVDNNVTHLLEGRLQGIYGQELAFTSGTGHLTLSLGALVRRASGNDRFSGSLFGQRFSHRLTGQKNSEYGGLLSLGFGIPVADRGRLFGRVEGVFLGRDDSDLSAVVGVQIDF